MVRRAFASSPLRRSLALVALFLASAVAAAGEPSSSCRAYPRLVPSDYAPNARQFDAVCLPEAWQFMRDRWQGLAANVPPWPWLVVIDDGFFASKDSGVRPEIFRGYPTGDGVFPLGTAWGDTSPLPQYGFHGTEVLSILASRANDSLIAGAVGPWKGVANGAEWGATFVPIRAGRGLLAPSTPSVIAEVFRREVTPFGQARVVNISKNLAATSGSVDLGAELDWANALQVVVATGAGNSGETVDATSWIRRYENVIVVGGLDPQGLALWNEPTGKTGTGSGVDLYAPAEAFRVIPTGTSVTTASGTSFSSPLVAAAAAMMLNLEPTLDSWVVRDVLVKTSDPIPAGVGRLNVLKALLCVDAIGQSALYPPPGATWLPVRDWWCTMPSGFGSASGRRVGW